MGFFESTPDSGSSVRDRVAPDRPRRGVTARGRFRRSARALTASLSVLAVLAWGAAASASNEPGSAESDGGASSDRDDARNLGDLTDLQRIRFANARLGGSRGTATLWRFELSEPRKVGLGLRRLDADADLVLEDAEGNELHSSRRAGTAKEWLSATLLTGEYFIRAEATEAGANRFKLRYGVGPADPAAVAELEAAQQAAATARSVSPQPDGDKTTDPPIVPKQGPDGDKTTDPPIVPRLGPGHRSADCPAVTGAGHDTTCVVALGVPVTGDREDKDDVDWFKVTLTMRQDDRSADRAKTGAGRRQDDRSADRAKTRHDCPALGGRWAAVRSQETPKMSTGSRSR